MRRLLYFGACLAAVGLPIALAPVVGVSALQNSGEMIADGGMKDSARSAATGATSSAAAAAKHACCQASRPDGSARATCPMQASQRLGMPSSGTLQSSWPFPSGTRCGCPRWEAHRRIPGAGACGCHPLLCTCARAPSCRDPPIPNLRARCARQAGAGPKDFAALDTDLVAWHADASALYERCSSMAVVGLMPGGDETVAFTFGRAAGAEKRSETSLCGVVQRRAGRRCRAASPPAEPKLASTAGPTPRRATPPRP